jgi:hypothetical protein
MKRKSPPSDISTAPTTTFPSEFKTKQGSLIQLMGRKKADFKKPQWQELTKILNEILDTGHPALFKFIPNITHREKRNILCFFSSAPATYLPTFKKLCAALKPHNTDTSVRHLLIAAYVELFGKKMTASRDQQKDILLDALGVITVEDIVKIQYFPISRISNKNSLEQLLNPFKKDHLINAVAIAGFKAGFKSNKEYYFKIYFRLTDNSDKSEENLAKIFSQLPFQEQADFLDTVEYDLSKDVMDNFYNAVDIVHILNKYNALKFLTNESRAEFFHCITEQVGKKHSLLLSSLLALILSDLSKNFPKLFLKLCAMEIPSFKIVDDQSPTIKSIYNIILYNFAVMKRTDESASAELPVSKGPELRGRTIAVPDFATGYQVAQKTVFKSLSQDFAIAFNPRKSTTGANMFPLVIRHAIAQFLTLKELLCLATLAKSWITLRQNNDVNILGPGDLKTFALEDRLTFSSNIIHKWVLGFTHTLAQCESIGGLTPGNLSIDCNFFFMLGMLRGIEKFIDSSSYPPTLSTSRFTMLPNVVTRDQKEETSVKSLELG